MKPKIKPRNPFVALAKFRKAGTHSKPTKLLRRHEKQALAKAARQSPESCHNRIAIQFGSVMAQVTTTVLGISHLSYWWLVRIQSNHCRLDSSWLRIRLSL
jgi:hypothetical protein